MPRGMTPILVITWQGSVRLGDWESTASSHKGSGLYLTHQLWLHPPRKKLLREDEYLSCKPLQAPRRRRNSPKQSQP